MQTNANIQWDWKLSPGLKEKTSFVYSRDWGNSNRRSEGGVGAGKLSSASYDGKVCSQVALGPILPASLGLFSYFFPFLLPGPKIYQFLHFHSIPLVFPYHAPEKHSKLLVLTGYPAYGFHRAVASKQTGMHLLIFQILACCREKFNVGS